MARRRIGPTRRLNFQKQNEEDAQDVPGVEVREAV